MEVAMSAQVCSVQIIACRPAALLRPTITTVYTSVAALALLAILFNCRFNQVIKYESNACKVYLCVLLFTKYCFRPLCSEKPKRRRANSKQSANLAQSANASEDGW